MNDAAQAQEAIVVERTFNAPVERIWQMWTQPEHLKKWYGPAGFTVSTADLDVRVGGRHLICMETQTPDGGMKFWTVGEYTEIVPNQRLVYTDSMADENGNLLPPQNESEPPLVTLVTVLLEDLNGQTRMVVTHAGVPADDGGAAEGWRQAFAKLADQL